MGRARRTIAPLLLAAALLAAGPARAGDLDSLTALALARSPRVRAAEAAWRAAAAQVPRAGALPDPTLRYAYEGSPIDNPSPTGAMEHRIELEQMLPFPGKQGAMRAMAAEEAGMARAALVQARLEAAAELRSSYYDLALAHAETGIREESRAALEALEEVARRRYALGAAPLADLLRVRTELAMEEAELAVLRQRRVTVLACCNAILDRPPETPIPIADRPEEPAEPAGLGDTSGTGLAALEPGMMAAQPMLRMRERAVARESHGLKLARREGLPDLVLGAGYMAMKEGPDSWMGMLGVTLPVWRGAKVGPLRREAEARLEQARAERDAARNDALRMLREAWGMAAGARAMARGYADAVIPQAEQALASARTAYETHAIGFLDLLDAQRSWRQARLAHQQALAEWRLALVELARVAGDGAALGLPPGDEGGTDE